MADPRGDEGRRRRWRPFLIPLVLVAGAALAVWFLWHQYMHPLWTRDARVRAAVIQVAPDVSGPITGLNVSNNTRVAQGDPLFVVDPERYRLALHQARAELEHRRLVRAGVRLRMQINIIRGNAGFFLSGSGDGPWRGLEANGAA